jgi:hypothetical protein
MIHTRYAIRVHRRKPHPNIQQHSWADLWILSGNAISRLIYIAFEEWLIEYLGLSIPLGLCGARGYDEILWGPNFGDTSYLNFKENVLPPTTDFVELETRKRTFWMAFSTSKILHREIQW